MSEPEEVVPAGVEEERKRGWWGGMCACVRQGVVAVRLLVHDAIAPTATPSARRALHADDCPGRVPRACLTWDVHGYCSDLQQPVVCGNGGCS